MTDRPSDIERGMVLVPRLSEIMPEAATGALSRLYEDTRQVLRVPFVNFIFRVLANDENYLVPEWDRVRPWARTMQFEHEANTIRSAALLDPVPILAQADWAALGDLDRIHRFTDSIHYVLPKLLLLTTAMHERLCEPHSGSTDDVDIIMDDLLPLGVAVDTLSLPMVDPEQADPDLRNLFDRIKTCHRHPGVATYYRSLGQWPAFLATVWDRIEPLVNTPAYDSCRHVVTQRAQDIVSTEAPSSQPATSAENVDDLRAVLSVFRFRLIPDLLLDATLVRVMLDGPEAACSSRFSAG